MTHEEEKKIEEEIAKFNYTKGNWHIKNNHIDTDLEELGRTGGYGHDHHFICDFDDYEYHTYDDKSEQLANMLLVQAAPVMLKALIYACMKCPYRQKNTYPPFCRPDCPIYHATQMARGMPKYTTIPEDWQEFLDKQEEAEQE